jgi:hypothetical protein
MKVDYKLTFFAFLATATIFLSGCSSTEQLVNQKYVKGAYLKTNSSPAVESKREKSVKLSSNRIEVSEKVSYTHQDTKVFEKKLELRYKREEGSSAGDILYASVLTPLALVGDAFLLGGLTVGEAVPFTAMVWEDVGDTDTNYVKKVAVVPNEYVEETSKRYSSEVVSLANKFVKVYLNYSYATQVKTNEYGVAEYDPIDLLLKSKIHPKDLVKGEGLKVTAMLDKARDDITISNSKISDDYFAAKFNELKPELMTRAVRLDNCQAISNGYREIFECFYQE